MNRSRGIESSESDALFEEVRIAGTRVQASAEKDHASLFFSLGFALGKRRASALFLMRAAAELVPQQTLREVLFEGFSRGVESVLHDDELARWSYPACAVRLDRQTIVLAANPPCVDAVETELWADGVARGALRDGIRRAIVAGSSRDAAASALALVGITCDREDSFFSRLRRRFAGS